MGWMRTKTTPSADQPSSCPPLQPINLSIVRKRRRAKIPYSGRVPKWTKGTDCKSVIRRFESDLGLFRLLKLLAADVCGHGRQLSLLAVVAIDEGFDVGQCLAGWLAAEGNDVRLGFGIV